MCLRERLPLTPFPIAPAFGGWAPLIDERVGRRAWVAQEVTLGRACRVHDFATVGSSPFQFVRDDHGTPLALPRCGSVRLGARVEVFPYADIALGLNGETVIGGDSKIGHHVHVGGNATIGARVLVCPHAMISGHVYIGRGAFIGVGAVIKPRVKIGAGARIGAGAVVISDVPDGVTVAGNPARAIGA